MMTKHFLGAIAAATLVLLPTMPVQAQGFPDRPVTLVVPFAAGGGADAVARRLAEKMAENLRQPVVVENKPGAATKIGAEYVKAAAPNGYTLLYASNSTHCLVPATYKSARFKATDFEPISGVIDNSVAVVVRKGAPFNDMKSFVEYAKANPNKVTFGTTGQGGSVHMLQLLINKRLDIKTTDVPYKGGAPALQDLLGNRLDMYGDAIQAISQLHNSGAVKVIAVSGNKRAASIADVPTFAEQGFDQLTTVYWWNLVAPKGTPKPVLQRLNSAVKAALEDKGVEDWLVAAGNSPAYSTPEAEARKIDSSCQNWTAQVKEFNISMD